MSPVGPGSGTVGPGSASVGPGGTIPDTPSYFVRGVFPLSYYTEAYFPGSGGGGLTVSDVAFVRASFRLEVMLQGETVWTDLTTYVLTDAGVQWTRGISGRGPRDRVADTGTLTWSLFNDASSSTTTAGGGGVGPGGGIVGPGFGGVGPSGGGGSITTSSLRGQFSPWHANLLTGWEYGIPVRLVAVYAGQDFPLWRGELSLILPLPGVHGRRSVLCTAVDAMDKWAQTPISAIPPSTEDSIEGLVHAISDAVDMPLWLTDPIDGELVDLDTSSDRLPYAFMDIGDGDYAVGLLQNVMQSALATAYVAKDGTFTTENRHRRPLRTPVLMLTDAIIPAGDDNVQVPSALDGVFNRLRVTVHRVTPGDTVGTVLYRSSSVIYVEAGETREFWGTYSDPDNTIKLLGGTDQIVPIELGIDYLGNTQADGSGDDASADLTIVTTPFRTTVKFTITNSGSERVYLVDMDGEPFLQIRGRALADDGPTTVEAYAAEAYGNRVETLDLPYLDDVARARSYAAFLVAENKWPVQALGSAVNPHVSDTVMRAALGIEIGDVIEVSETMTGLSSHTAYVQAVSGEIRSNFWMTMRLGLAPRNPVTGTPWLAGVAGRSEAGVSTLAGF